MICVLIFYFVPLEKVGMIQNFQAMIHLSSLTGITYFSFIREQTLFSFLKCGVEQNFSPLYENRGY
jgi:hypothetical protein